MQFENSTAILVQFLMATSPTPIAFVSILEQLNQAAAQQVYTPISDNKIRLITMHAGHGNDPIRCSLEVVTRVQVPEYEALSYVCTSAITCSHSYIHTTTNQPA
jgi:hypothetical protein